MEINWKVSESPSERLETSQRCMCCAFFPGTRVNPRQHTTYSFLSATVRPQAASYTPRNIARKCFGLGFPRQGFCVAQFNTNPKLSYNKNPEPDIGINAERSEEMSHSHFSPRQLPANPLTETSESSAKKKLSSSCLLTPYKPFSAWPFHFLSPPS